MNWAKCLPEYARTLNKKVKEELSWKVHLKFIMGASLLGKTKRQERRVRKNGIFKGKRMSSVMFGSEVRKLIPQHSECVET